MVADADSVFTDFVPDIYDDYLVPLIFERNADDLATRVAGLDPRDVLEVAAGSCVVSRAVAAVLDSNAEYGVTDLNATMLEQATSMAEDPGAIVWTPADAMDLPFGDRSFDVVLCQFGAVFFPGSGVSGGSQGSARGRQLHLQYVGSNRGE